MAQATARSSALDRECLLEDFRRFRTLGHEVALVTLVCAQGGSPRPLGSQMVVAGNGDYVGHLTGGCAEAVIADEAVAALRERRSRRLRLGAGSPYLDIRLPCGATVDLYIDVGVDDSTVDTLLATLDERQSIALDTVTGAEKPSRHSTVTSGADRVEAGSFRRWYHPVRRLLVYGKGPNAHTLATLGQASDYLVTLYSPDQPTLRAGEQAGVSTRTLVSPSSVSLPPLDSHTAVVLMFHEHDWEPPLLRQLLVSDVFYLGALGSRRTHQQRCQQLSADGFGEQLDRIRGPVGLDIGASNPPEIAIAILAEMTRDYRRSQGIAPLLEAGEKSMLIED